MKPFTILLVFAGVVALGNRGCHAATAELAQVEPPQAAQVTVTNLSKVTTCAEYDNIDIRLQALGVSRFDIVASAPVYIGSVIEDSTAPNFTNCQFGKDPTYPATPRLDVLYEDEQTRLVGIAYASFWRARPVPVTINGQQWDWPHLLQLFVRYRDQWFEVVVLYPRDGYWRARPLAPWHLPDNAYGSSFLVGPVEDEGRPLVDLADVAFDPALVAFTTRFRKGGQAMIRWTGSTHQETGLSVTLSNTITNHPFTGLRSMYVSDDNADVAMIRWRPPGAVTEAVETGILDFSILDAGGYVFFGRKAPSRHNLSAPDIRFGPFFVD